MLNTTQRIVVTAICFAIGLMTFADLNNILADPTGIAMAAACGFAGFMFSGKINLNKNTESCVQDVQRVSTPAQASEKATIIGAFYEDIVD